MITMHFRPEERVVVERSLDWLERATERNQPVLTPFLDPRERYILHTLQRRDGEELQLLSDGGFPTAERCRVLLAPLYLQADPTLFGLSFLRLTTTTKKKLEHRDVLGAILGLGIKRDKVGDISPHALGADVVVAMELSQFVQMQFGQIGREHVTIEEIAREEMIHPEEKRSTRTVTVASLRIDAVVAEGYRLSRTKSADLIKAGACKVNWKLVEQPDYSVGVGDIISLRGYGRVSIESIDGVTKKGRNLLSLSSFV